MPIEQTTLAGKRGCRYIRVSTDLQDVQRQIISTDKWFNRNNLSYGTHDYQEDGKRHESEERKEFQRMLAACERKEIDFILVDSLLIRR